MSETNQKPLTLERLERLLNPPKSQKKAMPAEYYKRFTGTSKASAGKRKPR